MTPAQKVAVDAMREAWEPEVVERMLRAVDPVSQERLEGIAEVAFVAWRDAERQNISTWKWVAGEVALALGLAVSPAETPAATSVSRPVCHCGDYVDEHRGMSHNHGPVELLMGEDGRG